MKNLKKILSALLAMVLVLCLVTGCAQDAADSSAADGSEATSDAASDDAAADGEAVEIRMAWWGSELRNNAFLEAFKVYHEAHPNVTIVGEYSGVNYDKVVTQLASGTEPDIMTIDGPWLDEFCARGDFFYDLTDQDVLDYSDVADWLIEEHCSYNGRVVCLPAATQCDAVYCDRMLWDEWMNYERDGIHTWSEWVEAGNDVHGKDEEMYILQFDQVVAQRVFYNWMKAMNGEQVYTDDWEINFTEDQALDCFNMFLDGLETGTFEPIAEGNLYINGDMAPAWANHKRIGWYGWSGHATGNQVNTIDEPADGGPKVAAVAFPEPDGAIAGGAVVRPLFCTAVSNRSQHIPETLEFLDWWFNSTESADCWTDTKGIPSGQKQYDYLVGKDLLHPEAIKALDFGMAEMAPKENQPTGNFQVTEAVRVIMTQVCNYEITPEEGVAAIFKDIPVKLADNKTE